MNRLNNCAGFLLSTIALAMLVILVAVGGRALCGKGLFKIETQSTVGTEDEQTIKNNLDTLKKLQQSEWEKISTKEKLEVLQCVANIESHYLGLPQELNVIGTVLGEYTLASYVYSKHEIQVNIEYLEKSSPDEALNSVCHEARHAYQYCLVETYERTDERYRDLKVFALAKECKKEFNQYVDGSKDFSGYYSQYCETDSRNYAEDAVNDYCEALEAYLSE